MNDELLSADIVRKLIRYDAGTGAIFWRERDPSFFGGGSRDAAWVCTSWNARFAGQPAFNVLGLRGYLTGNVSGKKYSAHRIIFLFQTGDWPKGEVDHINGVRTDNRWENLRDVTRAENAMNKPRMKSNVSGHTGVGFQKRAEKWRARITVGGRIIALGHYDSLREAVAKRKEAEIKYGFHPNHGRVSEIEDPKGQAERFSTNGCD